MLSNLSHYFSVANICHGINQLSNYTTKAIENLDDLSETISDFSIGAFNAARSLTKFCLKDSSLNISLNSYQNERAKEAFNNAKTRNGASTDEEVKEYHQSIEFDPKTKDGIFLRHTASGDKPKKLVILLMGNLQNPGMDEGEAGILKIYNQLKKENRHDLLLCRVGDSYADLKHKFFISDDCHLNTNIVYEHISNLIEDRVHSNGIFSEDKKPSSIDVVGYSWGGGVQKKIEEKWEKITGLKSARTAAIDAIQYGCDNFGTELCVKPNYSSEHLSISQNNEFLLNGGELINKDNKDVFIDADTIDIREPTHSEIDDSEVVQKKVLEFVNR